MAYTDFGEDYGDAHTVADTGAKFVVAEQFDLSFIEVPNPPPRVCVRVPPSLPRQTP